MNKAEQAEARLQGCKDADEAAELLPRLTVVQLRKLAKERKIVLPRTVRRKADIIAKLLRELFPPSKTVQAESRKWPEAVPQPHIIKPGIVCLLVSARSRLRLTSLNLPGFRQPHYRRNINRTRPP